MTSARKLCILLHTEGAIVPLHTATKPFLDLKRVPYGTVPSMYGTEKVRYGTEKVRYLFIPVLLADLRNGDVLYYDCVAFFEQKRAVLLPEL